MVPQKRSITNMNTKLLLIDFDGTICAVHHSVIHCIFHTYQKFNLPRVPDDETIKIILGSGVVIESMFKKLLSHSDINYSDKDLSEMCQYYRKFYASSSINEIKLYKNFDHILKVIKNKHLTSIIISNKEQERLLSATKYLNINHLVDHIIGTDDTVKAKPHQDMFNRKVQPLCSNLDLDNILIVGDTNSDIQFAKNCGFKSCFARYGYGNDNLAETADYVIDSPTELLSLVYA
ncbi:hypothetical protein AVI53_17350 (plasmid) [Piscirickettsia salmonis]|nr:hypothetical protein AWE47_17380 [Piscirickettsia salmonis]AMA44083.1 hypothetical protein AWJ11_17040 [Piscirickettsia salmonis]AOS36870.1 hypothetical protein AVM72_15965 [Piscirickettsia salmonis]APS62319.1 hypothetical protein AVI53_17350 [Piscirickettsia salmonis]APS65571.1 hypothetical protein AVI54_17345 [Piscirickettsia salmonis]